jgi:type I restriction enzyme S subunit
MAHRLDRLEDGDLVFVDASEDLSGVGKSVEISGAHGLELVSGLHTIAARFDKDVLAAGFKGYLQFCSPFRDQLARLAQGTKVFATTRQHIASVVMSLPGVNEQRAIARVLSESEREILALEAVRKKTSDVKLAMSQQLLTGKTRLQTTGGSNG